MLVIALPTCLAAFESRFLLQFQCRGIEHNVTIPWISLATVLTGGVYQRVSETLGRPAVYKGHQGEPPLSQKYPVFSIEPD